MKNPKSPVEDQIKEGGNADISNYEVPDSPVKIPDNDTGFALVKKNYRRFIWTMDEHSKKRVSGKDK
jgi:hypothetical protein